MKATSECNMFAVFEEEEPKAISLFLEYLNVVIKFNTQFVRNCSVSELLPIIRGKADTDAVIYSDDFKTYDGLVNYGCKKHYCVKHGENEFSDGYNHINGIENFWGLCKVRLAKFRRVHKHTFYLHIKEYEFRYSYRNKNIYLFLLKDLRKNKLN